LPLKSCKNKGGAEKPLHNNGFGSSRYTHIAELRAFATERLAGFKHPEALYLVDELPTTATGKIAKRELRAQVAGDDAHLERIW